MMTRIKSVAKPVSPVKKNDQKSNRVAWKLRPLPSFFRLLTPNS